MPRKSKSSIEIEELKSALKYLETFCDEELKKRDLKILELENQINEMKLNGCIRQIRD